MGRHPQVVSDAELWNADMDAWGLTGTARVHHLRRLHGHHRRIEALYLKRYERTRKAEACFALLLVASLLFLVVVA